jgi:hypothetical protein
MSRLGRLRVLRKYKLRSVAFGDEHLTSQQDSNLNSIYSSKKACKVVVKDTSPDSFWVQHCCSKGCSTTYKRDSPIPNTTKKLFNRNVSSLRRSPPLPYRRDHSLSLPVCFHLRDTLYRLFYPQTPSKRAHHYCTNPGQSLF